MSSACSSLGSARRSLVRGSQRGRLVERAPAGNGPADELARPADLVEELDSLYARHHLVGVPLDVELGVEGADRVEQRERALGGEGARCSSGLSAGRLVEGIAEEEQPVLLHVDHAAVGSVVAADVPNLHAGAPELEVESILKEDVRRARRARVGVRAAPP